MPIKIVTLGSSHSKRIHDALAKHPKANQFEISSIRLFEYESGSDAFNSKLRYLLKLTEKDHIIVQYFGNELFAKYIKVTHNPKTIHLTKFVPNSGTYLKEQYERLGKILNRFKAKVTIIDHFYRHLNCCAKHVYPGIVKYQAARNKELKECFSQFEVIDHRKTLGFRSRDLRDIKLYQGLFEDKVHLKPEGYARIADFLYRHIIN